VSTSETWDGVEAVLEECEALWAVSNIPQRKASEMRAELAQHMREATQDGKPVEAVVGEDVTIFALEWARENGPPRSLRGEVVDSLLAFLLMATLVALGHHLLTLSGSFGFHWYALALITVPTLGVVTMSPRTFAALINIKPRWKRELTVFLALAAVIGLPFAVAALTGEGIGEPLFGWSWFATLVVGISAVALWIFKDDPAVPGYEDVEPEPVVLDRAFVLVAFVVPLSTLAAVLASSFEPRLIFAFWWGIPGVYALILTPQNAARWRRFGAVSLGLAVLLTAVVAAFT
jgi:hypothetical protein